MVVGSVAIRIFTLGGLGLTASLLLSGQSVDFDTEFQQGAQAMRSGHLDEAAVDFAQCTAQNPASAEAYFNLGLVRFQQGRFDESVTYLNRTVALRPSLRGASLFLGIAQYKLDNYQAAVAALKRDVQIQPGGAASHMWLGISELALGDTQAAISSLETAAKLNPKDPDIFYHLGKAYMQMSKQTYDRMYQADPKSWRIHEVLSEAYVEADRLDDAAKECQEALKLKPEDPDLHQQLGDIYWQQNHLEQAEAEFQVEVKLNPDSVTAMYKLAAVSVDRSEPRPAIDLLTRVLEKHPDLREPHFILGRAEAQLGDNEAAIRDFQRVVDSKGSVDPSTLRQSYYQLSQLYRRTQHPDQSRAALEAFLRLKQEADSQLNQKLENRMKRPTEPGQNP